MLNVVKSLYLLLLIFSYAQLEAQGTKTVGLELNVGVGGPPKQDEAWDFRGNGVSYGTGLNYKLTNHFIFGGRFTYTRTRFDEHAFYGFRTVPLLYERQGAHSRHSQIVNVSAVCKLPTDILEPNKFYFQVGLGYYRSYLPDIHETGPYEYREILKRETLKGLTFDWGAGFRMLKVSKKIDLCLEGEYRKMYSNKHKIGDFHTYESRIMREISFKLLLVHQFGL